MARLLAEFTCSLDGFVADADGDFSWSEPDPEIHQWFNDREREFGTHLYGRRLYETMRVWQDWTEGDPVAVEYGEIWRGIDHVVYSRTLEDAPTPRTRIERDFDPARVRREVDALERDAVVGGATLAGLAMRAGIVDELRLVVVPHLVGGGLRAIPEGVSGSIRLLEERRFATGAVLLRYGLS
ncbi:dihydrofolate reductase family protein [Pseudolysinimonas sp.]|uniref:dihydrofolate reductase family protein n=1 Tax=Pseudolysinimonas sp. TaxID=2680009 RepID=UPI003F7D6DC9